MTKANIKKYDPETDETSRRHMNQPRKYIRSTKASPFEEANTVMEKKKKEEDVYTKVYNIREAIFSNQIG